VDPLDKKGSVGHQFTTDGKVGACPARLRAAGRRDLPGSWGQGGACLCSQVRFPDYCLNDACAGLAQAAPYRTSQTRRTQRARRCSPTPRSHSGLRTGWVGSLRALQRHRVDCSCSAAACFLHSVVSAAFPAADSRLG